MLLIYGDPAIWEAMSEQQRDEVLSLHAVLVKELSQSGELLGGAGLADPDKTITVRDGVSAPTVGPYSEAADQMSAFYLVECASAKRVQALAARILDPHVPAVEVRPIHTADPGD